MADIELLPLPAWLLANYRSMEQGFHEAECKQYARANVEHHTEKLRAEIEVLQGEVAEWKRVAAAQTELHDNAELRAERLEEALRHMVSEAIDGGHNYMLKAIGDSGASALLRDQEKDR